MSKNAIAEFFDLQQEYWDKLADTYHKLNRISVDDFHYGPMIPGESELKLLPPLKKKQKALELGCGGAQNSIWLARQGLTCMAIDVSGAQIEHARVNARETQTKIRFSKQPIERAVRLIKEKFDLIHTSHALQFVIDPEQIIGSMARLLNRGGTVVISTVHPLFHGKWIDDDGNDSRRKSGVLVSDYFAPPDDLRHEGRQIIARSRAYAVSQWFEWLRAANLEVTALAEPRVEEEGLNAPYISRAWKQHLPMLRVVPGTLIFVARNAR